MDNIDTNPLSIIILRGGNFGLHDTKETRTAWIRKAHTLKAFWGNRKFAWKYTRKEALWTIVNLFIGQFSR